MNPLSMFRLAWSNRRTRRDRGRRLYLAHVKKESLGPIIGGGFGREFDSTPDTSGTRRDRPHS